MFPQRPRAELETFSESIENSKKAKAYADPNEKSGFVDLLSDHGGKIALAVVGGLVALFYTYYASGKDRNRLEDSIADSAKVEPYEIQELRFKNKVDRDAFSAIVHQCKGRFLTGEATYDEFIRFLKSDLTLPEDESAISGGDSTDNFDEKTVFFGVPFVQQPTTTAAPKGNSSNASHEPRKLKLQSMHLLDRVIMGHCLGLAQRNASSSSDSDNSSDSDRNASSGSDFTDSSPSAASASAAVSMPVPVSWTDTPLDVDFLLVAFSLTMVPDAETRLYCLYEIAQRIAGDSQNSGSSDDGGAQKDSRVVTEEAAAQSGSGNESDSSSDCDTYTTGEDTISRGKRNETFVFLQFKRILYSINSTSL